MDGSEGIPVLANGDTGDQAPLHILLVEDDPGDALRQAQQLATLGRLTGGIAHHFNNLLGVVLNYTDFVADALRAPPSEATWREAREDVQHIQRASRRAAALIRQLTVFAEQDTVRAQMIQLNDVISSSEERLTARLRARTALDTELDSGLNPIRADRGHLELLLASLADNAAEAMPGGGTLAIRTAQVLGAAPDGMAGRRYVRLRVADTGTGIPPDILGSVFDPFFSTKPAGSSAGLGLTVARAITSRWGGRITLDSAPDTGTTVTVLFPAACDHHKAGDQAGTGDTDAR